MRGTGLGNLLFPWAKFILGTLKYNLTPVAPTWPQMLVGPLLRRESDKRVYSNLFVSTPEQVDGIKKLILLSTLRRVSEEQFAETVLTSKSNGHSLLVQFGYSGDYFKEFLSDHAIIRAELLRMTADRHKRGLRHDFNKTISVHVRLADFQVESLQTPLVWFERAIKEVRRSARVEAPVFIFSDGKDEELAPLLDLPGVRRLSFGSSIADLLALSTSNILIASGGSTYSKWASFIGRMPVIWPPGTLYQNLYAEQPKAEVELGIGESLPDSFVRELLPRF